MVTSLAITKSIDANEIIDSLPVGVAILDLDLRVQAMNRSLEAMTGFSREEAVGVSCWSLWFPKTDDADGVGK